MPTVEIIIDGTDYAPIIVFESARFESLVNGQPGRGYIRVRDDDRTLTFTGGEPVTLKIDGANVWRGWVTQPKRVYIAPALNIAAFGLTRFIDLECTDINVLFKKRIVFDQGTPANGYTPLYPPGTADLTALQDLFADWIDLSGDGLDTTTLVENVADITVDQSGRALDAADPWANSMALIASLPGAIWYIDPDKNVVYTDVDTPNAPFGLSDQPNGTTTRGYANMEILKDGTVMANDVLAWGMGYGSQTPVFTRETDAASVAEHGVWQRGQISFGVYKQATIDRIAESIVYGSPSNKRGTKDDRLTVALTTYEGGLRPAHKVDFTSNVFDFNDVIPIRKMVITFEAPDNPLYNITLSHEIDPPWSFVDPFFLNLGPIPPPPPPPPPPSPPDVKRICTPDDICGITDTFSRVVPGTTRSSPGTYSVDMGTSDSGNIYVATCYVDAAGDPILSEINGSSWVTTMSIDTNLMGSNAQARTYVDRPIMQQSRSVQFRVTRPGTGDYALRVIFDGLGFGFGSSLAGFGASGAAYVTINPTTPSSFDQNSSEIGFTQGAWDDSNPWSIGTATSIPASMWQDGETYTLTLDWDDTTMTATVSGNGDEFSNTQAHGDLTGWVINPGVAVQHSLSFNDADPWIIEIDNLDIPELTACEPVAFDSFQRVELTDWGTASSGITWDQITQQFCDFQVSPANGGEVIMPYANAFNVPSGGQAMAVGVPFTGAVTLYALMSSENVGSVGQIALLLLENPDFNNYAVVELNLSAGVINLYDTGPNTDTTTYGGWVDDDQFWVKWEWSPGVSSKITVWPISDPEPTTWLLDIGAIDFVTEDLSFFTSNSRGFTPNGGQDTSVFVDVISYRMDQAADCLFEDWNRTLSGSMGSVSSTGQLWENVATTTPAGVINGTLYADKDTVTGSPASASIVGELDPIDLANRAVFQAPFTISSTVYFSQAMQSGLEGSGDWDIGISSSQATVAVSLTTDWDSGAPYVRMRVTTDAGTDFVLVPWPGGLSDPASSTVRITVTDTNASVEAFGYEVSVSGTIGPLPGAISTLRDLIVGVSATNLNQTMRAEMGPLVVISDMGVPTPWCPVPSTQVCYDVLVGFPFSEVVTPDGIGYVAISSYMAGSLQLVVNGLLQRPVVDYVETNPSTGEYTLNFTPSDTDNMFITYSVGP